MGIRLWTVAALVFTITASARAIDLYNGTLPTPPEEQGWLTFGAIGGTPVRTTAAGKTSLDTTAANSMQGGYSNYFGASPLNPLFPVLDRTDGFVVTLDMRVLSESHVSNNRAGVSLIALASDLLGIEVAFWEDEVWVQSGPDFIHAEGVAFDTTAAMTRYELSIHGGTYSIAANGNPILTGNLRNYSAFGPPYSLPNFMFLGDNTTSAAGSFEFSRLAVVPEPSASIAGMGGVGLLLRRRRGSL